MLCLQPGQRLDGEAMEVVGYSERGLVNSIFYAIKGASNSGEILRDFLSLITFHWAVPDFEVSGVILLIEPSFSDFGDADAVLLLDTAAGRCVVFLEAKVKTTGRSSWAIGEEFARFENGIKVGELNPSNLFAQIYHKVRMVTALNQDGISCLEKGLQFPPCSFPLGSTKSLRKIGQNPVVLRATEMVSLYCTKSYFVGILPCGAGSIAHFSAQTLKDYQPDGFQGWSMDNWGYITWAQVEAFCKKWQLSDVEKTFRFNQGQIY